MLLVLWFGLVSVLYSIVFCSVLWMVVPIVLCFVFCALFYHVLCLFCSMGVSLYFVFAYALIALMSTVVATVPRSIVFPVG